MSGWVGVAIGVILSLAVNEFCDISPWLARRVVLRAAQWWTDDAELRQIRSEEWLAVIDERPGKLFKLGTALSLLGAGAWRHLGAAWTRLLRAATRRNRTGLRPGQRPQLAVYITLLAGGFVAFFGLGMANPLVVSLGVTLAIGAPVAILVLNSRRRTRTPR